MCTVRYLVVPALVLGLASSTPAQSQTGVPSRPAQLTPLAQPGAAAQARQANQPGVPSSATQLTPLGQQGARPQSAFGTPLYRDPNVARSLGLTQTQLERLNATTAQLQSVYRNRIQELGTINQAQRAARIQNLLSEYNNRWAQSVGGILNAGQMNRYRQLELRAQGLNAFDTAPVQQGLKLTASQRQQFQNLNARVQREVATYQRVRWNNPDVAAHFADIYRRQWWQAANNVLTPAQRTQWSTMTGQPGPALP